MITSKLNEIVDGFCRGCVVACRCASELQSLSIGNKSALIMDPT